MDAFDFNKESSILHKYIQWKMQDAQKHKEVANSSVFWVTNMEAI